MYLLLAGATWNPTATSSSRRCCPPEPTAPHRSSWRWGRPGSAPFVGSERLRISGNNDQESYDFGWKIIITCCLVSQIPALHQVCCRLQLRQETSVHRGLFQRQFWLEGISPSKFWPEAIPTFLIHQRDSCCCCCQVANSAMTKCSVCRTPQQTYCALFKPSLSTNILGSLDLNSQVRSESVV